METELDRALFMLKKGEELEEFQLMIIANSDADFSNDQKVIESLKRKDLIKFDTLKLQTYLKNINNISLIRMGVYSLVSFNRSLKPNEFKFNNVSKSSEIINFYC